MLKIVFSLVLTSCVFLSSSSLQAQTPVNEPLPPKLGLRVIEVIPHGQAERAGIQYMDTLSKYGKFTIIDHSTYYKARAEYLKNPDVKVELEFWRGPTRLTIEVVPGNLGIVTNEKNIVAYKLEGEIKNIEILRQIPEYKRHVEFKDAFEKEGGIPESLRKAKAIVERAEAEGTLTPTQLLVARIRLILDDAPVEELKHQEVLLAEFIRDQPPEYIGWLAGQLTERGHYRAARVLLKHYLLIDPTNVSLRLSLGFVNSRLRLYDEVDAAADQSLANPNLSPYKLCIAYQQKAIAAISRGDYKLGTTYAEKAFVSSGGMFELLLIQFVAATTGDLELFNNTAGRMRYLLPEKYESFKLQIDSAEVLALAMKGQEERARQIIASWSHKDRVEGRLRYYWSEFPNGEKVVENWLRLATKN